MTCMQGHMPYTVPCTRHVCVYIESVHLNFSASFSPLGLPFLVLSPSPLFSLRLFPAFSLDLNRSIFLKSPAHLLAAKKGNERTI